mmetsp:Transcript_6423/g.10148  ORF Transcript_6423/g.10148 Transcript_6423/m.10148 type:complete len:690 (+) Transcript_6423:181-2250(+)
MVAELTDAFTDTRCFPYHSDKLRNLCLFQCTENSDSQKDLQNHLAFAIRKYTTDQLAERMHNEVSEAVFGSMHDPQNSHALIQMKEVVDKRSGLWNALNLDVLEDQFMSCPPPLRRALETKLDSLLTVEAMYSYVITFIPEEHKWSILNILVPDEDEVVRIASLSGSTDADTFKLTEGTEFYLKPAGLRHLLHHFGFIREGSAVITEPQCPRHSRLTSIFTTVLQGRKIGFFDWLTVRHETLLNKAWRSCLRLHCDLSVVLACHTAATDFDGKRLDLESCMAQMANSRQTGKQDKTQFLLHLSYIDPDRFLELVRSQGNSILLLEHKQHPLVLELARNRNVLPSLVEGILDCCTFHQAGKVWGAVGEQNPECMEDLVKSRPAIIDIWAARYDGLGNTALHQLARYHPKALLRICDSVTNQQKLQILKCKGETTPNTVLNFLAQYNGKHFVDFMTVVEDQQEVQSMLADTANDLAVHSDEGIRNLILSENKTWMLNSLKSSFNSLGFTPLHVYADKHIQAFCELLAQLAEDEIFSVLMTRKQDGTFAVLEVIVTFTHTREFFTQIMGSLKPNHRAQLHVTEECKDLISRGYCGAAEFAPKNFKDMVLGVEGTFKFLRTCYWNMSTAYHMMVVFQWETFFDMVSQLSSEDRMSVLETAKSDGELLKPESRHIYTAQSSNSKQIRLQAPRTP